MHVVSQMHTELLSNFLFHFQHVQVAWAYEVITTVFRSLIYMCIQPISLHHFLLYCTLYIVYHPLTHYHELQLFLFLLAFYMSNFSSFFIYLLSYLLFDHKVHFTFFVFYVQCWFFTVHLQLLLCNQMATICSPHSLGIN